MKKIILFLVVFILSLNSVFAFDHVSYSLGMSSAQSSNGPNYNELKSGTSCIPPFDYIKQKGGNL